MLSTQKNLSWVSRKEAAMLREQKTQSGADNKSYTGAEDDLCNCLLEGTGKGINIWPHL